MSVIYLDRLGQHNQHQLSNYNIHWILVMGVVTAAKFIDDIFYTNKHYAKIAGVPLAEFNILEKYFLE